MDKKKDELVTAAELARRLNINRSYIAKKKIALKESGCAYGNKFYFEKSSKLLGKNPNNPHESYQARIQKKETFINNENINEEIEEKPKPKKQTPPKIDKEEVEDLLSEIERTLKDKDTVYDKALLDGLKAKAAITKTYYEAENEKIKNRKLEADLFERDEVIKILSFAMSMIRNSLINTPNNYAVSLEGMNQKEIKDYVTDDINRILEDLQNVGNQF